MFSSAGLALPNWHSPLSAWQIVADVAAVLVMMENARDTRLYARNSDSGRTLTAPSSIQAGLVKTESSRTQCNFPEHSERRAQVSLLGFQRPMKTVWAGVTARP